MKGSLVIPVFKTVWLLLRRLDSLSLFIARPIVDQSLRECNREMIGVMR